MNSFITWIGGKNALKKEICSRIPEGCKRYIEVFGGAAWVLFAKEKHADMEIYNDANGDLVNLFRVVKYHCGELQKELSCMLNSRELFEDFKAQCYIRGMTDIQRAARFFMLIKSSYGANLKNFGCVKKDISVATEYLTRIQDRLSNVLIENKDFEILMKIYDKPNAFIYMDPPYYGTEKYYQAQFSPQDHERLYKAFCRVEGKCLLSYNDCEYIRVLYSDYTIEEVQRNHNLVNRYSEKDNTYSELLIRNY